MERKRKEGEKRTEEKLHFFEKSVDLNEHKTDGRHE